MNHTEWKSRNVWSVVRVPNRYVMFAGLLNSWNINAVSSRCEVTLLWNSMYHMAKSTNTPYFLGSLLNFSIDYIHFLSVTYVMNVSIKEIRKWFQIVVRFLDV